MSIYIILSPRDTQNECDGRLTGKVRSLMRLITTSFMTSFYFYFHTRTPPPPCRRHSGLFLAGGESLLAVPGCQVRLLACGSLCCRVDLPESVEQGEIGGWTQILYVDE